MPCFLRGIFRFASSRSLRPLVSRVPLQTRNSSSKGLNMLSSVSSPQFIILPGLLCFGLMVAIEWVQASFPVAPSLDKALTAEDAHARLANMNAS